MTSIFQKGINKIFKLAGYEKKIDPFAIQTYLIKVPQTVIFDVGAHIGTVSLEYEKKFSAARIYAFEPFPESFSVLRENIKDHAHINGFNLAFSNKQGVLSMYSNTSSATNSLLQTDPNANYYWGKGLLETNERVSVQTDMIDSFCQSKKIDHINILKLDVQGSEFDVLVGANDMLASQLIDLIYMEIIVVPTYTGQKYISDYFKLLYSFNYYLFDVYNPIRKGFQLNQADFIFCSSNTISEYQKLMCQPKKI